MWGMTTHVQTPDGTYGAKAGNWGFHHVTFQRNILWYNLGSLGSALPITFRLLNTMRGILPHMPDPQFTDRNLKNHRLWLEDQLLPCFLRTTLSP